MPTDHVLPEVHIEALSSAGRAGTGAGDEAERVVAGLHVLPEVHVGVVEDVAGQAQVVEALRRQHHAHVVTAVEQRYRARPELRSKVCMGLQLLTQTRMFHRLAV